MNNTVGKLSAAALKLTPFPKYGQPPAPIPFYSYYLYVILKMCTHIHRLNTYHDL